jgi:hypothetical protein
MGLRAIHAALVGKEKQPVVRRGDKEVLDDIVGAQSRPPNALAAALLRTVVVAARPLDVPAAGDGDDHFLDRNQIFVRQVALAGHNRGSSVIAELVDNLGELGRHNFALKVGAGKDFLESCDELFDFGRLVENLLAFESG